MTDHQQPKITYVFVQVYYAAGAPTFAEFRPNEHGSPMKIEFSRHVDYDDIPVHLSDVRTSVGGTEHTLVISHIGTGTLRTDTPVPYKDAEPGTGTYSVDLDNPDLVDRMASVIRRASPEVAAATIIAGMKVGAT